MANKRMLSKSISTSLKVNSLPEFAQLLFTWMIPHTDDFGRLDGEAEVIKALVMPMNKRSLKDFEVAIALIAQVGLINWYQSSTKKVIEVINADEHQSKLIGNRTKSKFPDKNEFSLDLAEVQQNSATVHNKLRLNLTKPNLTKPNLTQPNPSPTRLTEKAMGGEEAFNKFWETYPKHLNKGQAERIWRKLNPSEQLTDTILQAVERAKTSDKWRKDGGQYIPYPATWLNAKGWEDDYKTEKQDGIALWAAEQERLEKQETVNGSL